MAAKNSQVLSATIENMEVISARLDEIIAEFGQVELMKPVESYLFGCVRTIQASCQYVSHFARDIDKQNKVSKAKESSNNQPNQREE